MEVQTGALGIPQLRRVLIAQLPADFADWLDFVAVGALLAFTWHVEPVVFALLALALGLPYVLLGPLAGVLVDRSDIRTVLVASNLGRAAMTASLAFAPNWPILLVLIFVRSSVDAFFTPAKQAAIQAVTQPNQRLSANGISHAINQASKIVAPALGGALLVEFDPGQVFLLNALISMAAVIILVGMAPIRREGGESSGTTFLFAGIGEGWREVSDKPRLRAALALMAGGYFGMFFYDTLIPPLTRDLGFDETDLGLAFAAVGAGGVLGSVYLAAGKQERRPFAMIGVGSAIAGVFAAALGLAQAWPIDLPLMVFLGTFFVLGLATAMTVIPVRTVIQTDTSPERMARVTALSEAANTSALLIAPFLGAAIASLTSSGIAFVVGGGLLILIAFCAMLIEGRQPDS